MYKEFSAMLSTSTRQNRLIYSLGPLAILLGLALIPMPAALEQGPAAAVCGVIQLILALGLCWWDRSILLRGANELRHLRPRGAALILLGVGAALLYGTAALVGSIAAGDPVRQDWHFESVGLLLVWASFAEHLWKVLMHRAMSPLFRIEREWAEEARVLRDGKEKMVSPDELRVGDVLVLRGWETIPADATVLEGVGIVNEHTLNAVVKSVKKFPGSPVYSGGVLEEGALTCRVERVGADTSQARMVELVNKFRPEKGRLGAQVERLSGWLTLATLGLAVVAFLLWMAAGSTAGDAMGVALAVVAAGNPMAILPGVITALRATVGTAAWKGIYFRTPDLLQQAAHIRTVALDTSAALDAGEPEVVQVTGTRRVPEKFLLGMAAGLSLQSADPLARAILRRAEAEGVKYTAVAGAETLPGGLRGKVAGKVIAGGGQAFITENCPLPADLLQAGQELESRGATALYFALAGSPAGVIGISHAVRPDAAPAVASMQALGLDTAAVSHAPDADARQMARQAGLRDDQVRAGLADGQLTDAVAALQAAAPTLLVGGVDTEPAAFGAAAIGAQIGAVDGPLPQAAMVLMRRNLNGVPLAIELSRQMEQNIHKGLRGAAVYYTLCPLLAALGLGFHPLIPVLAACAALLLMAVHSMRPRADLFPPWEKEEDNE